MTSVDPPGRDPSRWPTKFRVGVTHGLGIATMFSAFVLLMAALGGQAHNELGVSLPALVLFYYLGGVAAGLVYGGLAPLATWWLGRACVGFLVMFPVGVGGIAILPDAGLDDPAAWLTAVVFAAILGGLGGPHFLDPEATVR